MNGAEYYLICHLMSLLYISYLSGSLDQQLRFFSIQGSTGRTGRRGPRGGRGDKV